MRLDPGDGRVATTRQFQVWEGGGEYNVARGLRRCFGLRTAIVTALADNPVGRLVEDLMLQGGVDQSHVRWVKYDGVGREVRNGLNFTERGFGVRAALGCSDRGHTAVSQLKPGQIDWDLIFATEGTRWFHTGGIFARSPIRHRCRPRGDRSSPRNGVIVSYDLNYRDSLWKSIGGKARALEVNSELAPMVDVMLGNEEDFTASLGFEVEGADEHLSATRQWQISTHDREEQWRSIPNFKVVATTLRNAKTATVNDWGAICYAAGEFFEASPMPGLEIFDRVGGGDSFASGLIYGFMAGEGPAVGSQLRLRSWSHGDDYPGDTTMVTLGEVERVMKGGTARVQR